METSTVSLQFGKGIDTKSDPKLVLPTKINVLQNAIFTNTGRLTKRNGYTKFPLTGVGGYNISSPVMTRAFNSELVIAAKDQNSIPNLYSWSPTLNAWNTRGKYFSIKTENQSISNNGVNSTSALLGNFSLFSYQSITAFNPVGYISVYDITTNAPMTQDLLVPNSIGSQKAVVLGGTVLAVLYITSTTPNTLAIRTVSVTSGSGVVFGSEVTIGTCTNDVSGLLYEYDVVPTTAGASVAVANNPNINVYNLNTSGATTASATITGTGQKEPLTVTRDSTNGNLWIQWVDNNASLTYAILSSSLATVLAKTTIATDGPKYSDLYQITSLVISTTQQKQYYIQAYDSGATNVVRYANVYTRIINSNGTFGAETPFIFNASIYSKPVTVGGLNYMAFVIFSGSDPTGVLLNLDTGIVAAKFLPSKADGIIATGLGTSTDLSFSKSAGWLDSFQSISSTKIFISSSYVSNLTLTTSHSGAVYPADATIGAQFGVSSVILDFANKDANQSIVQQDLLALNGGVVSVYDGAAICEMGFTTEPQQLSGSLAASGGSLTTGNYVYYATYSWIDAMGNLYESASSTGLFVIVASGSASLTTINVPTLSLTQKSGVLINLYRTQNNGTIAYRVGQKQNSLSTGYVTFTDGLADASIISFPTLYTEGGSILDNIAPPPAMIMWTNNNRLWVVDSENPETTLEYSKTASKGTGISFSTGLLEYLVDSRGGSIAGASPMDEKTVLLKDRGLGYFVGDGANDAGNGSTLSAFQFIPSDVGCTNSKSVLLYPGGVIFRSTKGVYLVNRGAQVQYFASDVEQFNSQDITSATIVGDRNQIRFLTSSGSSLLYDYFFNQWSVFTNSQGYSSDIWSGSYVYVRTDGNLYLESSSSFLDDTTSYQILIQTSWIKATTIQNFQRVRQVQLLGDYYCPAADTTYGVRVSFAFDFIPTFTDTVPFYFAPTSGVQTIFQEEIFTPRQKCDGLQIKIVDLPTGISGEYIDFSDMGLEIAAKTGMNKLASKYSTG